MKYNVQNTIDKLKEKLITVYIFLVQLSSFLSKKIFMFLDTLSNVHYSSISILTFWGVKFELPWGILAVFYGNRQYVTKA
jgi:hypothetical protein